MGINNQFVLRSLLLDVNDLRVKVLHQTVLAIGSADATLAPSGMEALDGLEVETVDVGLAEEQLGPGALNEAVVIGEQRRREAILAIVGKLQRLIKSLELGNRNSRPEDLFLHNFTVLGGASKNGRGEEVSGAVDCLATAKDGSTSLDGAVNHTLHLVQLILAHKRTVLDTVFLRTTKLDALHLGNKLLHEGIVHRGLDVNTLGAVAHLTRKDDTRRHNGFNGLVKVGICHNNARGLTTELKADLAHIDSSIGHDSLAGGDRAGHADDAWDWAGGERFSDGVAVASDNANNSRREVELTSLDSSRDVRHELEASEGSELASLDNDGATGQEGGGNLSSCIFIYLMVRIE